MQIDPFVKEFKIKFPVFPDPDNEIHELLGGTGPPGVILSDIAGKVLFVHEGVLEDIDFLLEKIREATEVSSDFMSHSMTNNSTNGNGIEHPILKKLPREIRQEISRMAEERVFPAGTTIFDQGDPGDCFFMIKSGKVRIFRETKDLMMTELTYLGPGDSFGEMALLTGAPRAATVEAVKDTHLRALSKAQFDKILQKYPEMSLSLIIQMASWLIENDQMLELEKTRQYQPAKVSILILSSSSV